jgi:hypothetical protein
VINCNRGSVQFCLLIVLRLVGIGVIFSVRRAEAVEILSLSEDS